MQKAIVHCVVHEQNNWNDENGKQYQNQRERQSDVLHMLNCQVWIADLRISLTPRGMNKGFFR